MINCILKLLGISLTQGYDTFWTWSILVVPLALGLLFLLIKSIRGASGYYDVGRTHAIAGWILVVAGILCYVAVALWSDSIRMDYKLRVIRNVQDHTQNPWPNWPRTLKTTSSHEEGCTRRWNINTLEFLGKDGKLTGVKVQEIDWKPNPEQGTSIRATVMDLIRC